MSEGSPFQTFYLLFKSNSKEAKKDMLDLQQASDSTKKKIKETKEETNELGKAFTDAVDNGLRALAGYASFNALKTGVVNAQQFNRELTIQSQLWGQNANEVNAWGKAVKQAGGDQKAFLGWYQGIRQQNAAVGRNTLAPNDLMRHINQQVQGLSPAMQQNIFGQYGIGDIGQQSILAGTPEELEKTIKKMDELTKNTAAGAAASQQFGKSWDNTATSLEKFFTTVNTESLPRLANGLDTITNFFNSVANNKEGATAVFIAMGAAATVFTASIPAILAGFGAISAAALALMPVVAAIAASVTLIAGHKSVAAAIDSAGRNPFTNWLGVGSPEDYANEKKMREQMQGFNGGPSGGKVTSGSAMDYLMKNYGLKPEHAAGIVANMQAESGGNPSAAGDGGSARGLFQWHPDRQAKIKAGTGIDVTNATTNQQLDAMMWELQDRGQLQPLLNQKGAFNAASYFSSGFEKPADGVNEAMKRGMAAMDIAGNTPFASASSLSPSSGGGSVTIDKIEVNTQATDSEGIARDIGSALQRQIGNIYAQNNDAVAY